MGKQEGGSGYIPPTENTPETEAPSAAVPEETQSSAESEMPPTEGADTNADNT